jgi:voltage-gated potassium channel
MVVVTLVRRLMKSFVSNNLRIIALASLIIVALGTVGVYYAENPVNSSFTNFGDSFWWTMVTMSTVGYGDKVPITFAGRTIGIICMLSGPILMVSFITSIGVEVYNRWMKGARGMAQIKSVGHLIICGWNKKAEDIIGEIRQSQLKDLPITVIDNTIDTKPVDDARISFVKGNASELGVLERANIAQAKFAIVLADHSTTAADQKTVLTVLSIEKRNPSIVTCAELNDTNNEEYLRNAGCDIIVNSSSMSSRLLAMSLVNPSINNIIRELISQEGNEVYRVALPKRYYNHTFIEIMTELKKSYGVMIIGIEREGKSLINPSGSEILKADDFLLAMSTEAPSF